MGVESQSAREAARLLIREPVKYGGLVAGLYLLPFLAPDQGRLLRASYLFFRHLDDFLDETSDRKTNKISYALDLRAQIESGNFTGNPKVVELAKYSLEVLQRKSRTSDNPRQDFLNGIDVIIFDYQRAKERRVLTSEELGRYYHDTFFPVVNLTLIGFGSQFRAIDIPALSYGYGRVFTVRDLEEDWQRGVINIPLEILQEASLNQSSSIADVKRNPTVGRWLLREVSESLSALTATKIQLQRSSERITPILCNGVIKTAQKLIAQYTYKNNHSLGGMP